MVRKTAGIVLIGLVGMFSGCERGKPQVTWHELTLTSGTKVKITSYFLTWGIEHDERSAEHDSFAVEYATPTPHDDQSARDREARDVFELVRPNSERLGLAMATVSAFPTLSRKGHYDMYIFERGKNGEWSSKREDRKVFVDD